MMDIAYENQKLLDFGICLSLSLISFFFFFVYLLHLDNHLTTEQICNKIYETRKESKLIVSKKNIKSNI